MNILDIINAAAERRGVNPATMRRIAEIESNMNPRAKNPRSTASGLFQFTRGTAQDYGLNNPFDPVASSDAAARLAANNSQFLENRLGRPPSPGEVYLAHQQGAGGAANLLTNPNKRAADIVGRQAVVLNGGHPDMSAREFADLWTSKVQITPTAATPSTTPQRASAATPMTRPQATEVTVGPPPACRTDGQAPGKHGERC